MGDVFKLVDRWTLSQAGRVRDRQSDAEQLREALQMLGGALGREIVSQFGLINKQVETPMGEQVLIPVSHLELSVIATTLGDSESLGTGLRQTLPASLAASMDFGDTRGNDALTGPVRSMSFPEPGASQVDLVVVGKAVLASGCTALRLARELEQYYRPKTLVIVAAWYSAEALEMVRSSIPAAHIIVVGEPDRLDANGMLMPGIGLLEERLDDTGPRCT